MTQPKTQQTQNSFESFIEEAKLSLEQLNSAKLTLKESLEIYNKGIRALDKAQKLLEEAQLQFEHLQQNNS